MCIQELLFPYSLLTGLVLATGNVLADQVRAIDLVDGSVVVGEIVSADHGAYTVKTDRLGIITLKDSDIVAIRTAAQTPGPAPSSAQVRPSHHGESLQSVRQRIMGDATLLQSVNALKDDPEIQKILQDPELMKAIQAGNIEALKDNPKIQDLMNNPTVQGIYQTLGH